MEELGVEVHLNSLVTDVEPGRIKVGNDWIPVRLTLWASGVAASPLGRMLSPDVDKAGRVPVQPDLSLKDHPEVFVIGDMASLRDTKGVIVPGLRSSSIQMGHAAAANILGDLDGRARKPFTYFDKGTMATIGRNRAIALIGPLQLSGLIAWLTWGLVHIVLLIGFRNRFSVMREWVWAYITGQGSARLITGPITEAPAPANVEHPREPVARR